MQQSLETTLCSYILTVVIAGCGVASTPARDPNAVGAPQDYHVEIVNLTEPVYETIRTETIDQPNCNGTAEVENIIERVMGVNHSIELGLGLSVDMDGKLELLGTGVNLGVAIASELGYQYGVTESLSRSIVLRAAPQSHVVHKVTLREIWESGTARVTANGQSMDVPFRFRADFAVNYSGGTPIDCLSGEALVPPTLTSASACRLPIRGTYNYSRSNVVFELGPGVFTFYDEPGGGAYGNDTASCELNQDCTELRAINKDSADPDDQGVSGQWVDAQTGVSSAQWDIFVVECSSANLQR